MRPKATRRLVKREDGRPYETEEGYFREVLGLASWRTAYKRLAIGRMLAAFPEPERAAVRTVLSEVGVAKAAVIAPAIERTGEWQGWVDLARRLATPVLQARVSAALQALPRGREVSPPGERFRRAILSAMPDIEAMEVVERFFEIGAHVVGTAHPIAIFLAGCRECLAEWEVQAAPRWRNHPPASTTNGHPMQGDGRSLRAPAENDRHLRRECLPPEANFAHMGKIPPDLPCLQRA